MHTLHFALRQLGPFLVGALLGQALIDVLQFVIGDVLTLFLVLVVLALYRRTIIRYIRDAFERLKTDYHTWVSFPPNPPPLN